ncbi:uncharacterized protein METZ01_LOCUS208484, partial [marine metagenome]
AVLGQRINERRLDSRVPFAPQAISTLLVGRNQQ